MLKKGKIEEFLLFKKSIGRSENTIKNYRIDLFQFFDNIKKIDKLSILEYINKIGSFSPASRQRKITTLKEFLKYIGKSNLLPTNLIVKVPKRMPIYLDTEEIEKLRNSINDRKHKLIFNLFLTTGLRVSELVSLKKENIVNSHIKIIRKGNKEQILPIPNWLSNEIHNYIKSNGQGELLIDLHPSSVNRIVHRYISKAGINKNVSCHKLRHTFATESMNKGIDLRTLQELMGHSSINTTSIYLHTNNKMMDEKYRKVWG